MILIFLVAVSLSHAANLFSVFKKSSASDKTATQNAAASRQADTSSRNAQAANTAARNTQAAANTQAQRPSSQQQPFSGSQNNAQASAQGRQQAAINSQPQQTTSQRGETAARNNQATTNSQASRNVQSSQAQAAANQVESNVQQASAQVTAQATQTALTAEEPVGVPASQAAAGARWRAILPDLRGITFWFNNLDSSKVKSVLTVQNLGESVNICWNYKDYKNEIYPDPDVQEVYPGSNCNQDYPPGSVRPTVFSGYVITHSRKDGICNGYNYVGQRDFRINNRDTELPCYGSVVVYSEDNTQPILPSGVWCIATRAPSNSHEQFMCVPMNFVKESDLPQ